MKARPDHRIVFALSMVLAGCDMLHFDGLGEAIGCAAVNFGESLAGIGAAFGAPGKSSLEDDSGEVLPSVVGTCFTDECKPRIAQVGTKIEIRVDGTDLAARQGVELGAGRPELISTDPRVIEVANGEMTPDPCSNDHLTVRTAVKFTKEGRSALRVQLGALVLASFSYEVAQATSLRLSVHPEGSATSLQIDSDDQGTRSVRGGLRVGMRLKVQAYAADGREMLLDNSVVSTIEDPAVARFSLSNQHHLARGVMVSVVFLREGSTTLRVESGELTSEIALHVDPSLPSPSQPAAGSASPSP